MALAGCKTLGRPLAILGRSEHAGLELFVVWASRSWDKTIHIWKPSKRNLLVQLKDHVTWVKSIAFSFDGSQLASAGYSSMVTPLPQVSPSKLLPPPPSYRNPQQHPERSTSISALNRRVPRAGLRHHPLLHLVSGTKVCAC